MHGAPHRGGYYDGHMGGHPARLGRQWVGPCGDWVGYDAPGGGAQLFVKIWLKILIIN